jgi:hypothetical protein
MINKALKPYLLTTLILATMFSNQLIADIFMKQKQTTAGFQIMGKKQGDRQEILSIWMGNKKFRSDGEKQSTLLNQNEKVMYIINHEDKSVIKMPLDIGTAISKKIEKEPDAEEKADFMKFAKGMMNMKITVETTNESKKINNWQCNKYIQTIESAMGPITSEIWATEDLKVDAGLYAQFSATLVSMQSMMGKSMKEAAEELKKIKGVAVLTTTITKMMGFEIKSITELLEYKEGSAPAGTYDYPKGYNLKEGGIFD